jgi:hypothetical protein
MNLEHGGSTDIFSEALQQTMKIFPGLTLQVLICGVLTAVLPNNLHGEDQAPVKVDLAFERLPEAPVPQIAVAEDDGPQEAASPAEPPKTDQQKADEQIKAQLRQRALGIVPMFNITYLGDQTVSMTVKQKFELAIHSSTDPVDFVTPFFVAGLHEGLNDQEGFPWGVKGLGERAGAAYLDALGGNLIGSGLLPSILHQDPRYYRIGYGSAKHRLLYALATTVICKHDKTGKWEPNYSNVGGNIAAGAISTLYYPPTDEGGVGLTITNGLIVTATGAAGAVFNEFWPDISRKLFHKDPTNGLDAKRKAAHATN